MTTPHAEHAAVPRPPLASVRPPADPRPAADLSSATGIELDSHGVRIRFGDQPNQTVPASWAEAMLRCLIGRNHALFGSLMVEASTGQSLETRRRTPKTSDNEHD